MADGQVGQVGHGVDGTGQEVVSRQAVLRHYDHRPGVDMADGEVRRSVDIFE